MPAAFLLILVPTMYRIVRSGSRFAGHGTNQPALSQPASWDAGGTGARWGD
jgi:hypothetical protein